MMIQHAIQAMNAIDGLLGGAVVDASSGLCLSVIERQPSLELETAAAIHGELLRMQMNSLSSFYMDTEVEDVVFTHARHVHLVRLVPGPVPMFVYLVLDRADSNIVLARRALLEIAQLLREPRSAGAPAAHRAGAANHHAALV